MTAIHLLQIPSSNEIDKRLPTFEQLREFYGPTLSLIISIVFFFLILFLIAQAYWFNKRMKDKKEEVAYLREDNERLFNRNLALMDRETGYTSRNKREGE